MSTTTHHLTTPAAPWKSRFLSHISQLPSPEFVFATLHVAPSSTPSPNPYVPRLRYCIYRGMWAELPENKHNDAPKNDPNYESEMPTFTTDVRMRKVGELFASSEGHATSEGQTHGSGGGGPVEAVWWIKDVGSQWRIQGEAYVVAPDIEGEGEQSSGVRTVKSKVGERMRQVKEGSAGWSWGKELTAHFGNMSPGIRGSMRNPPPGSPVASGRPDEDHELGQKVTDLHDPIARENFRVVIIKPDVVEHLDISDPAKARRWTYTFVEKNGHGEWLTEEQWP